MIAPQENSASLAGSSVGNGPTKLPLDFSIDSAKPAGAVGTPIFEKGVISGNVMGKEDAGILDKDMNKADKIDQQVCKLPNQELMTKLNVHAEETKAIASPPRSVASEIGADRGRADEAQGR